MMEPQEERPKQVVVPGHEAPSAGTLGYFFREAIRRLWIARRTSFIAVAMITIALLTLGGFLLVSENLSKAIDGMTGSSRVTVYLEPGLLADDLQALESWFAARPEFAKRRLVPREEAMERFKSHFSNLSGIVDELGENPFPASFEITVTEATVQSPGFDDQIAALMRLRGVDDVQFDWRWIARLRQLVHIINVVGGVAGGILTIAAAFTIASVIRLTMVLYREEIDIMRLVGATEKIVRGPFLAEGFLQGVIGGLLALTLLYAGFEGARRLVGPSTVLIWNFLFVTFLPWWKSAALVGGGIAAGMVGTWLSLRDYSEETPVPE
ncbi:MAG: cell division protein FtsX [Thermoanaerobaculia bacterium]